MKLRRGQSREVPPERKAVAVEGLSIVFDKLGYGRGQYTGMVFSN